MYKDTKGIWKQFDCIVCMILESKYQVYLKHGVQNFVLDIKMGKVYFDRNIIIQTD